MDYPAKIILFGEYGILLNSKALAIPYPRFFGRFRFPVTSQERYSKYKSESNNAMANLNNYIIDHSEDFDFLDIQQFESDLALGMFFDSTIPSGSGLGSSGALSAAIYDRYAVNGALKDLPTIKSNLAAIEACFHGVSSGIDPFISWIRKPVLFRNMKDPDTTIDLFPFFNTYTLFLINSYSPGNTGVLVNHFMEKYQEAGFKELIEHEYIPVINQTIDSLLASDFSTFEILLTRYSKLQLAHFPRMIPEMMINHFNHGLKTGQFNLKICGSGGGGYILGISRDRLKAESYFNLNQLDYTVVEQRI